MLTLKERKSCLYDHDSVVWNMNMKLRSATLTGTVVASLMAAGMATGQQAPAEKQLMSEQAFKNVKVLKGIPVSEFMDTMSFFAASVGLNCVYCHVEESMENWDRFAEDVPRKQ